MKLQRRYRVKYHSYTMFTDDTGENREILNNRLDDRELAFEEKGFRIIRSKTE